MNMQRAEGPVLNRKDKKTSCTLLQSSQIGTLIPFKKLSAGKSSLSRLVQRSLNPQALAGPDSGETAGHGAGAARGQEGAPLCGNTCGLNMFVFTRTCVKCSWRKGIVGSFPAQENPAWSLPTGRETAASRPHPPTPDPRSVPYGVYFYPQPTYIFLLV